MVPQSLMGVVSPGFGPDTSAGLLPMPQVLLYYAVFFGFGALLANEGLLERVEGRARIGVSAPSGSGLGECHAPVAHPDGASSLTPRP